MLDRRPYQRGSDLVSRQLAEKPTIEVLKFLGYSILESQKKRHIIDVVQDGKAHKIFWEARGIDREYEYQAFKQNTGPTHWSKIRTSAERYTNFLLEGCTEFCSWVRTPGRCESLPLLAIWPMQNDNFKIIQLAHMGTTEAWVELGIEQARLYTILDDIVAEMTWDDQIGESNLSEAAQSRFLDAIYLSAAA